MNAPPALLRGGRETRAVRGALRGARRQGRLS